MGSSASTNNNTQSRNRPKSSPPSKRKTVANGDAGGSQTRDPPKSAISEKKAGAKDNGETKIAEVIENGETKQAETVTNGETKDENQTKEAARTTNPGDPPNYHRSQIPPPRPPRTCKTDIFTTAKYKEVDDYVLNAPPKLLVGNFNELVKYLTRDNERWDDMCKIRAIFLWVTSIDVYNLKVDGVPPTHSPLEYFTKIQCNMGNHAHLISGLCQMAGIPCVIISGMNKSAAYDIGSKCDRKSMGAQWNAVYLNDDWRFLDAFWASACVVGRKSGEWTLVDSDGNVTQEDEETSEGTTQHRINEFYFLPDPDKLIWTHFPDEPQWQLLDRPVTQREFEDHVYMRERFHYLGMKLMPNSHDKCLLTAKDGELELVFSLPVQQSETSRFKYMLYQGRSERGSDGDQSDLFLDRFVMFEHTANLLRFTLRFPIKGKFKMDIFGLDINESDIFDLACTYIITCNDPKANCLPLPDIPPIGWGPGANAKEAGLKPITHDGAIIVTKDGNVEIRLAADKDIQLHQMLKHALIDEATLSNYAVTRLENGEAVVNIRLPQGGEYALKLYADAAGNEGSAPNVLNYLIKSEAKNIHNQPFPNVADGTLGKKPAAGNLGVKAISHKGGNIQAKNGRARVEFQARTGVQVMVELHSSDEMACKTMAVMPKEENGKWTFDLDMPDQGEYSLNVFACNKNSTDRIYNVHTYLVNSDGRKLEPGELDARNENKNILTNIPIETVQTSDNEVFIPVPPGFENIAASLHRRNANDPPNANQVDIIEQDGMQLIRAKLPEFGEYLLNLYDRDTGGVVRNIAKYQINRKPPGELYEDNTRMLMSNLGAQAPIMEEDEDEYLQTKMDKNETDEDKKKRLEEEQRRATRRQIQKAIDMKDAEMLERYIQAYEKLNPPFDDEVLQKARRTLAALDAKEALTEACQRRDLDSLKKAIARAKEVNFDHQLDLQLALANRLKDQLERIEKLRHSVLNLDTKTIAEIKTYSNPPDGVHQSMMATFILLGNTPKEVKSWRTCQALVGKTGRESLMRRISSFDPKDCNIAVAQQAKFFIDNYSMSQIRDVSAGAATFYGWLHDFAKEVIDFVLCQSKICDEESLGISHDTEHDGSSNERFTSYETDTKHISPKNSRKSRMNRKLCISTTESIDLLPGEQDRHETNSIIMDLNEKESVNLSTPGPSNQEEHIPNKCTVLENNNLALYEIDIGHCKETEQNNVHRTSLSENVMLVPAERENAGPINEMVSSYDVDNNILIPQHSETTERNEKLSITTTERFDFLPQDHHKTASTLIHIDEMEHLGLSTANPAHHIESNSPRNINESENGTVAHHETDVFHCTETEQNIGCQSSLTTIPTMFGNNDETAVDSSCTSSEHSEEISCSAIDYVNTLDNKISEDKRSHEHEENNTNKCIVNALKHSDVHLNETARYETNKTENTSQTNDNSAVVLNDTHQNTTHDKNSNFGSSLNLNHTIDEVNLFNTREITSINSTNTGVNKDNACSDPVKDNRQEDTSTLGATLGNEPVVVEFSDMEVKQNSREINAAENIDILSDGCVQRERISNATFTDERQNDSNFTDLCQQNSNLTSNSNTLKDYDCSQTTGIKPKQKCNRTVIIANASSSPKATSSVQQDSNDMPHAMTAKEMICQDIETEHAFCISLNSTHFTECTGTTDDGGTVHEGIDTKPNKSDRYITPNSNQYKESCGRDIVEEHGEYTRIIANQYKNNYNQEIVKACASRNIGCTETILNTNQTNCSVTESKIFIPTDNGEESSCSDHNGSDNDYENRDRLNVSENSDEDMLELKALLEFTAHSRTKALHKLNETTNGKPCEDYVHFVRERTIVSTKPKKVKKKSIKKNCATSKTVNLPDRKERTNAAQGKTQMAKFVHGNVHKEKPSLDKKSKAPIKVKTKTK